MAVLPGVQSIPLQTPEADRPIASYQPAIAQEAQEQVGAATAHAGAQVFQAGGQIGQAQSQIEMGNAEQQFVHAKLQADEAAANDPDFAGAPGRYIQTLSAAQAKFASTIQDPAMRAEFQANMTRLSSWSAAGIIREAHGKSVQADQQYAAEIVKNSVNSYAASGGGPVGMLALQSARHTLDGLVTKGSVTQQQADAMAQSMTDNATSARAESLVASNPALAAKLLAPTGKAADGSPTFAARDGDDWTAAIPTARRAELAFTAQNRVLELQEKADRLQDQQAAIVRVNLGKSFSAASAIVDNGQSATAALSGVTDAQINAAYPRNPEQAQAVKEQVNDLRTVSTFQDRIAGATPQQLMAIGAALPKPDPNDPATYRSRMMMNRAFDTAITRTGHALATDPASYVLGSHPDIAALGTAADKDPTQFPSYAAAVLGMQSQMGVPASEQSVLPVPAAAQMARSIMSDPTNAPAKLKQMQQQYGAYFPDVWRDLVTRGKLPAAYQAVGTLDDEGQAALLARGLAEQGKSGKNLVDLLPPKVKSGATGIDTSIESAPAVTQFLSSLSRSGASAGMQSDTLGAIKTLAYANMIYGGKDQSSAVDAAVTAFTGKYEFMPNGGARVPADKFDAVAGNADAALKALSLDKLAVPSIYGKPGMPEADEYLNLLRSSPSWITSPHADALWLMDNGGRIVRDKTGMPVAVPFNGAALNAGPGGYVPVSQ